MFDWLIVVAITAALHEMGWQSLPFARHPNWNGILHYARQNLPIYALFALDMAPMPASYPGKIH